MKDRFGALLSSRDRNSNIFFAEVVDEVRRVFLQHGIQMRQDDGELVQINVSLPQSLESSLVLGLRYRKRDGTLTEDHFLYRWRPPEGLEVIPYYRRGLERILPEYGGTHKAQVDLPTQGPWMLPSDFATDVRTITFTKVMK